MTSPAGFLTVHEYLPVSYMVASVIFSIFPRSFSATTGFPPLYQFVIMGKVPNARQLTKAFRPSCTRFIGSKFSKSIFGSSVDNKIKKKLRVSYKHNCGRHRGPGRGSSPGWVVVLCCWARHFTLTVPLSTQEYKWILENCHGNLAKCWKVTCDGLVSHPGGVAILLVGS